MILCTSRCNYPDTIPGLAIPSADGSVAFATRDDWGDLSQEHGRSVHHSQELLAEHGVELNAQLGDLLLQAGVNPSSP